MAYTYSLLASAQGTGSSGTVSFKNIPQNYTDLVIKTSTRITSANTGDDMLLTFNGVQTSFSGKRLRGNGTAASSTSSTANGYYGGETEGTTYTASTFSNVELYIPNYTSSNNKSISVDSVTENNAAAAYSGLFATLWSNVTAITSITFTNATASNWDAASTFYLYGIRVEL